MKKLVILSGLLVLLLLIGCSGGYIEENLYNAGATGPSGQVTLELDQVYRVNDYFGFSGNTLKMFDVCYDTSIGKGYAAGIMTHEIAVFSSDSQIAYIDTGLGEGSFELKYLHCGDGKLFVSAGTNIQVYDGETYELIAEKKLKNEVHNAGLFFDDEYLYVPITFESEIQVFNIDDLDPVTTFEGGLGYNFFWNDQLFSYEIEENTLYQVSEDFERTEFNTFDFFKEGERVNLLSVKNELWILLDDRLLIYGLDSLEEKPISIDLELPEAEDLYLLDNHVAIVSQNGFDDGTVGGYFGGVSFISIDSKEIVGTYKLPHKHKKGSGAGDFLYLTNNEDNSIMKVSIDGSYEIIRTGSSTENGVVLNDGSVMTTNRLGGSSVMHLVDGEFTEIETNEWPVGISYDSDLDQVYTFDFLTGVISVIKNNAVVDSFDLGFELETDGIGDMTYDQTRKMLYVVAPERNEIIVVDALTGETLHSLYVEDYMDDYEELSGAGTLIAGVYEPTMKLFVFAQKRHQLFIYDGMKNFKLTNNFTVGCVNSIKDFPYSLFVDNYHDLIYLCGNIYDSDGNLVGETPTGYSVIGVDNDDGLLFSVKMKEEDNELERLIVMDTDMNQLASIDMNENQYVKARFAYDDVRNKMYAFYMVPSEIWAFDVLIDGE